MIKTILTAAMLAAAISGTASADTVYQQVGAGECNKTKMTTVDDAVFAIIKTWPGNVQILVAPTTETNNKNGINGRYTVLNTCINDRCMEMVFTNAMAQCQAFRRAGAINGANSR